MSTGQVLQSELAVWGLVTSKCLCYFLVGGVLLPLLYFYPALSSCNSLLHPLVLPCILSLSSILFIYRYVVGMAAWQGRLVRI